MDFFYCYEKNGYKEARNQLKEDERAYLFGYKQAIEDVKNYVENNIDLLGVEDEDTTIGKMETEIVQTAGENLLELLDSDWHESLISFLDDHGEDESDGQGKLSQNWKIPEPPSVDDEDEDKEE